MIDDELPPTDDAAEAPVAAAPMDEAGAGAADPDDGPDSGPLADAPPLAAADERPREVIRGIHAELLCTCPECDPDFVELQWFSPDEPRKVKGDAMLFCARSSRKYFTPIVDLNTWLAENGGVRKGKSGRGESS
jgi:hypothetical protein